MKPISVMLVDDNPTFLRVATRFLEAHDEVAIVGTAGGGKQALIEAQKLRPQVILLDLTMPDLMGLEAIPRLRSILPDVGIITLTLFDTDSYRQAAFAAGADDFISKRTMDNDLLPAIQDMIQTGQQCEEMTNTTLPTQEQGLMTPQRILIMEDDDQLRRLFSKALSKSGYDIYPAATIKEARELLASSQFDIFLCDINMGNDDLGTDLLREQHATLSHNGTQIIIVSGEAQYRSTCEEMGVDFYLEKPVTLSTLLTLVARLTAQE